jgi:DNA-binding SARP family transcriptional activator
MLRNGETLPTVAATGGNVAKLELKLLGGLEARVGAAPVAFPTRHCMLLLAYLALKPDLAQTREALSALFWGEREDAQARSSLRQTLYRLRQTLDGLDCPVLDADHRMVRLSKTDLVCDVSAFEAALGGHAADLPSALDLYQGDLLADCGRTDPNFDGWLREERMRVRILAVEGFRRLAGLLREQRRFAEMEIVARRLVNLDEYDEEAHRLLMAACSLQGRRNAALAAYSELAEALSDQLGVSPEPETVELFRQIRERRPMTVSSEGERNEGSQERLHDQIASASDAAPGAPEAASALNEPERRQVTALAVNLTTTADDADDADPETSMGSRLPVLQEIAALAKRFGGHPCPVVGDEFVVLFGATTAQEDHALRACNAALAIGRRLSELPNAIAARIGLHSGEMIVRGTLEAQAFEGVAAGPPMTRAQQLARSLRPGAIGLTRALCERIEGYFETAPVKGDGRGTEPARGDTYLLISATGARDRLQARAGRELSAFAGRSMELSQLKRALGRTRTGRGEITAIVGEAGIGKSRLLQEFLRTLPLDEITLLQTGATSQDKETTYAPIADLLRTWLGAGPQDTSESILEKLDAQPATQNVSGPFSGAALRSILGLAVEDEEWADLSPPQRRTQIIETVRTVLIHESRKRPTVIACEDLHWIDDESQAVLDGLIDDLPGARLMLLVTYRPEYRHDWVGRSFFSLVRVDALPDESALGLIDSLLGSDESLDRLRSLLLKQCGGVPLFIEESVRALAESDSLAGAPGSYRLAKPVDQLELAPTIRDVLAARIDRLATPERSLLQRASVIGTTVPLGLLRRISECSEKELMDRLGELRAAEFLYQTGWHPEEEYEFKHALTHEVAYRTLLKESRRTMHAQLVDVIESLHGDRLNAHVERLSHHASQGEIWDKAALYLTRAGENAVQLSAYQQAHSFLARAVEATDRLPRNSETLQASIDVRLSLRPVLVPAGQFDATRRYLEEAEALAAQLQDDSVLSAINIHKSYMLSTHGALEEAIDAAERGLAIAMETSAEALGKEALLALGQSCSLAALSTRTIELLEPALSYWIDENRHERFGHTGTRSIWCLGWLGNAHAQLGEFDAALRHTSTACDIAAETNRPVDLLFARHRHGAALLMQGELDRAIPHLEAAFETARATDAPIFRPWAAGDLGYAYVLAGCANDGERLLREARNHARERRLLQFEGWNMVRLADAGCRGRRPEAVADLAGAALKRARDIGDQLLDAVALRMLAAGSSSGDDADTDTAERYLKEAIDLAEQRGLRPELAHCRRALGDLHRQAGRQVAASAEHTAADKIERQCAIKAWPGPAEN